MSERVNVSDLETAAAWLDCNEGTDDSEGGACRRVAEWLRAEAARRELRATARSVGVPVALARKAIARLEATAATETANEENR